MEKGCDLVGQGIKAQDLRCLMPKLPKGKQQQQKTQILKQCFRKKERKL